MSIGAFIVGYGIGAILAPLLALALDQDDRDRTVAFYVATAERKGDKVVLWSGSKMAMCSIPIQYLRDGKNIPDGYSEEIKRTIRIPKNVIL